MPTCSVLILTANRALLLTKCLQSLARQTLLPTEVIVVNNGSSDQSANLLRAVETPFPLKVITRDGAGGYAEARNAALAAAGSELVAFLDDDCEADSFWLERMVAALAENDWVAAGGMVLPAEEIPAPDGYTPEICWAAGLSPLGLLGPEGGRVYLPATASIIAQRSLFAQHPFQELGGRLAGQGTDYAIGREDAQWWRELRRVGHRVGIARRALAWHNIPADRLEWSELAERIANDGVAHWHRTHNHADLEAAGRDVVFAPVNAFFEWLGGAVPFWEVWRKHSAWHIRQWAFLSAAVNDSAELAISPGKRLAVIAKGLGAVASSTMRSGLRGLCLPIFQLALGDRQLSSGDQSPGRILVVVHDLMGDAVLALSMVQQLADALPETEVIVLTGPTGGPLFRNNCPELADTGAPAYRVMELPTAARGQSLDAFLELRRIVKGLEPDAILMAYCHGLHPAALLLHRNIPVISWTHDNGIGQRIWGDLVSHPITKSLRKAEAAAQLDLLAPFGVAGKLRRPVLRPSDEAMGRIEGILLEAGCGAETKIAVIQYEIANRFKSWPTERFEEVVRRFLTLGWTVFLDGARGSRGIARDLCRKVEGCHALHGALNSDELTALLKRADFFLGYDSGPAHIASAVGCKGIVLFGMLEIERWGPLPLLPGEEPALFTSLSAAQGDWIFSEISDLPLNHGMQLLSTEVVWKQIEKMIDEKET